MEWSSEFSVHCECNLEREVFDDEPFLHLWFILSSFRVVEYDSIELKRAIHCFRDVLLLLLPFTNILCIDLRLVGFVNTSAGFKDPGIKLMFDISFLLYSSSLGTSSIKNSFQ